MGFHDSGVVRWNLVDDMNGGFESKRALEVKILKLQNENLRLKRKLKRLQK